MTASQGSSGMDTIFKALILTRAACGFPPADFGLFTHHPGSDMMRQLAHRNADVQLCTLEVGLNLIWWLITLTGATSWQMRSHRVADQRCTGRQDSELGMDCKITRLGNAD